MVKPISRHVQPSRALTWKNTTHKGVITIPKRPHDAICVTNDQLPVADTLRDGAVTLVKNRRTADERGELVPERPVDVLGEDVGELLGAAQPVNRMTVKLPLNRRFEGVSVTSSDA